MQNEYFVEYKVRPVIRYLVTRYHEADNGCGSHPCGEFESETLASNAVLAFGDSETLSAQPPKVVKTSRPMPGGEQTRTWTLGVGWDDSPRGA